MVVGGGHVLWGLSMAKNLGFDVFGRMKLLCGASPRPPSTLYSYGVRSTALCTLCTNYIILSSIFCMSFIVLILLAWAIVVARTGACVSKKYFSGVLHTVQIYTNVYIYILRLIPKSAHLLPYSPREEYNPASKSRNVFISCKYYYTVI